MTWAWCPGRWPRGDPGLRRRVGAELSQGATVGWDEYLRRWSQLHGGLTPSPGIVRGWLRMVYVLARVPVALRMSPSAVTAAGLVVTAAALPPAIEGGRWPVLAALAVAVGGLLDSLDGAVAVLTGRVSRWGALLDGVADRLGEVAFGGVLVALGAPVPLVLLGVGAGWLLEYVRARAGGLGVAEVGVISVGERPTRLAVVAMSALAAAVHPGDAQRWALAGAVVLAAASVVGLGQVLVAVRRLLR